jgi:hypothetical protein
MSTDGARPCWELGGAMFGSASQGVELIKHLLADV